MTVAHATVPVKHRNSDISAGRNDVLSPRDARQAPTYDFCDVAAHASPMSQKPKPLSAPKASISTEASASASVDDAPPSESLEMPAGSDNTPVPTMFFTSATVHCNWVAGLPVLGATISSGV